MVGEYNAEDGEKLLNLARESIEHEFTGKEIGKLEGKQFMQLRGVFVTLHKKGKLRGCIGIPYPVKKIYDAVVDAAKNAGFSDPRFPSLQEKELEDVKIEISILTSPQEVKDAKEIVIGKDGLMCNYLGYQGLLLPQVASEYKMSRIEFLEALCNKAGLPKDKWQDKNFKLWKFQAQIFSE